MMVFCCLMCTIISIHTVDAHTKFYQYPFIQGHVTSRVRYLYIQELRLVLTVIILKEKIG
jgi:hypothetical protein